MVSASIGTVETGATTPFTLRLIGASQEMKMSEACFSAISLNNRSRYMVSRARMTPPPDSGQILESVSELSMIMS